MTITASSSFPSAPSPMLGRGMPMGRRLPNPRFEVTAFSVICGTANAGSSPVCVGDSLWPGCGNILPASAAIWRGRYITASRQGDGSAELQGSSHAWRPWSQATAWSAANEVPARVSSKQGHNLASSKG